MSVEFIVISAPLQKGGPSEDAVVVTPEGGGRPFTATVVDGHGHETDDQGRTPFKSPQVAQFARTIADGVNAGFQSYPDPDLLGDIYDSVSDRVDATYCPLVEAEYDVASLVVGAVASTVVLDEQRLHLAQTGDCRLYACLPSWVRGFRRLSRDHNSDHPGEIERLRPLLRTGEFRFFPRQSGFGLPPVPTGEPDRLYHRSDEGFYLGALEPTRVFGDYAFRPAVTPRPECRSFELDSFPSDALFALCSDGGNRFVEEVYTHFRGKTGIVPLEEIRAYIESRLGSASDDVTVIFFRQH